MFNGDTIKILGYLDCGICDDNITDDDIFYYGLSEDDIKEAISLGEDTMHDFVIVTYSFYKEVKC